MNKRFYTCILFTLTAASVVAQMEPIRVEGAAQGTTYHITYYDEKNRDLQPEIEKILAAFDQSVSTYIPGDLGQEKSKKLKNQ